MTTALLSHTVLISRTESSVAEFLRLSSIPHPIDPCESQLPSLMSFLEQRWMPAKDHYTPDERASDLAAIRLGLQETGDISSSPFMKPGEVTHLFQCSPRKAADFFDNGLLSGYKLESGDRRFFIPSIQRRIRACWLDPISGNTDYTEDVREMSIQAACGSIDASGHPVFTKQDAIKEVLDLSYGGPIHWWNDRKIFGVRFTPKGPRKVWIPSLREHAKRNWVNSNGLDQKFELDGLMGALHKKNFRAAGFCLLNQESGKGLVDETWLLRSPGMTSLTASERRMPRVMVDLMVRGGAHPRDELLERFPTIHERNVLVWSKRDLGLSGEVRLNQQPLTCKVTTVEDPSDPLVGDQPFEVAIIDASALDSSPEALETFESRCNARHLVLQTNGDAANVLGAESTIHPRFVSTEERLLEHNIRNLVETGRVS